jgi:hypothetical protein
MRGNSTGWLKGIAEPWRLAGARALSPKFGGAMLCGRIEPSESRR